MLGLESLYGILVVLALLALYAFWKTPNSWRVALLGLWLALATLTRSEGIILFAFLALPAIVLVRGVTRAMRWKMLATVAAVGIVIVGPWVVRNLTTFEKPTLLGTGFGWVLLDGSCDTTYYGPKLGYWDDSCALKNYPPHLEETLVDRVPARRRSTTSSTTRRGCRSWSRPASAACSSCTSRSRTWS